MSQRPELSSCEKIFEFRCGCRHATHSLVAADSREHDTIPLRDQAHPELGGRAPIVAKSWHKAAVRRFGRWFGRGLVFRILRTDIDVPTSAATLFLYFSEIGTLVPIGFGIVVHCDRIEPRDFGGPTGDDDIGHADDG